MKKIFVFFLSLLLVSLPFFFSLAQFVTIPNPLNATSIEELIENIIDFITWTVIILAPLIALIGAFYILTSGGKPQQVDKGKKAIFYAFVAIFVVLFARGIIGLVQMILSGQ
jgi:hypothetical protein